MDQRRRTDHRIFGSIESLWKAAGGERRRLAGVNSLFLLFSPDDIRHVETGDLRPPLAKTFPTFSDSVPTRFAGHRSYQQAWQRAMTKSRRQWLRIIVADDKCALSARMPGRRRRSSTGRRSPVGVRAVALVGTVEYGTQVVFTATGESRCELRSGLAAMVGKKPGHRVRREPKKPRGKKVPREPKTPPNPAGAIPADPNKQDYGLGGPLPYYEDEERVCVQCQKPFTFTAKEQKYWYETLRFINYSTAIRCVLCRRRKRSAVAFDRQVALARQSQQENPRDPLAHLALAQALVGRHARVGTGRLADSVAAARKAGRLDPNLHEAVYWEAASQEALGRQRKADELYRRFLERAASVHHCRPLVQRARRRLGLNSKGK